MTLPKNPSPTPIDNTFPVCLTGIPSSTPEASPISTTPIDSSSRFSATPIKPPGNSNNSEAITFSRPFTLATPSAIVATCPTTSSFSSFSQPLRLSFNDFEMSLGSNVKSLILTYLLKQILLLGVLKKPSHQKFALPR